MRTTTDLERMIDGQAQVKLKHIAFKRGLLVSPWPYQNVLSVDPYWFDEENATDSEVRRLLQHGLAMRRDWMFTAISILGDGGLSLLLVSFVWNVLLAPAFNFFMGEHFVIDYAPMAYGLTLTGIMLFVRFSVWDTLDRRAHAAASGK